MNLDCRTDLVKIDPQIAAGKTTNRFVIFSGVQEFTNLDLHRRHVTAVESDEVIQIFAKRAVKECGTQVFVLFGDLQSVVEHCCGGVGLKRISGSIFRVAVQSDQGIVNVLSRP